MSSQSPARRAAKDRWYKRHHAQAMAERVRYQKEHPQRTKEIQARSRAKWQEKHQAACRLWRKENLEQARQGVKRWEQENPDAVKANRRKQSHTHKARKRGAFVEAVDPCWVFDRDEGICGICDEPVKGDFHIDHIIPLALGGEHSYTNVQLAHPLCNMRKGASLDYEQQPSVG